jgi:hypothetical protein
MQREFFLFNVPHRGMEFLNYPLLEQIKDQMVFSLKYESKMKILSQNSYVIVFTNESPDMHQMIQDCYKITNLSMEGAMALTFNLPKDD